MSTFEDRLKDAAKLMASKSIEFRRLGIKRSIKIINSSKISYDGLLLIVKGLYITLWQQDKLLLQETIVNKFVRILNKIKSMHTRQKYICAIFETLAREYDKMDKWRFDKFLALTRKMFVKGLIKSCLDGTVRDFVNSLFTKVLNTDPLHATDLKVFTLRVIEEELICPIFSLNVTLIFLDALLGLASNLKRGDQYTNQVLDTSRALTRMLRLKDCSAEKYMKLSDCALQMATENQHLRKFYTGLSKICFKMSREIEAVGSEEMETEPVEPSPKKSRKSLSPVKESPKVKARRVSMVQLSELTSLAKEDECPPNPNQSLECVSGAEDNSAHNSSIVKSHVSFGKIYRKKFSAKKRLSLPNIPSNAPTPKSILKKRL